MTSELRGVLFHVRKRLIQVRETLLQDKAAAESQLMTLGQAVSYLKDAINLELARPYATRKAPISNASRAERAKQALRCYLEAKGGQFDNTVSQIPELIADLLHLKAQIDRGDDPVESTLRRARAFFVRETSQHHPGCGSKVAAVKRAEMSRAHQGDEEDSKPQDDRMPRLA